MRKFIDLAATGFGLGKLPKAPGTWGSLLGLLIAYLLSFSMGNITLILWVLFFIFSVWVANEAQKQLGSDHPSIVIDEMCGMSFVLLWLPVSVKIYVVGFILFRIFDISKIPPLRYLEKRFPGGYGIVVDDVFAALYAKIVLAVLFYFHFL